MNVYDNNGLTKNLHVNNRSLLTEKWKHKMSKGKGNQQSILNPLENINQQKGRNESLRTKKLASKLMHKIFIHTNCLMKKGGMKLIMAIMMMTMRSTATTSIIVL